ncbi:MAG: cation:proton antiporter [Armatimonadaceae bacterium]
MEEAVGHAAPVTNTIENVEILMLIAAIVAMIAHRFRLPYTVGLVLAGVVMAVTRLVPDVSLTKELIFTAFLPPLVFEAAFYIQWRELRRDFIPVITLASFGVLISGALVATGMHFLVGWEWAPALVFGALIAATDPVSVIAIFKEAGVHGRLRLLVEAESLLNDGAAAVIFTVILATVSGAELTAGGVAWQFVSMVVGGVACGLGVGWVLLLLAGRTEDHLVEITFTTVAAYGSFLLAEHFHFSGVLATLSCGLLLGNVGSLGAISDRGREAVGSFWEYAAFVANSLVFLLIGITEGKVAFLPLLPALLIAIVIVTAARGVVYPLSAIFARTEHRIEPRYQHVLFWGGLRGALSLALVLGLPDSMPRKGEITVVAFGVVAFSIIVQGVTMQPLLAKLGLMPKPEEKVAPWELGPEEGEQAAVENSGVEAGASGEKH